MITAKRYLVGAAPLALGLALASPASAQIQPSEQNPEENEAIAPVLQDNAIVVTGTRLNNPNLEQASPVAVVTEEEIELRQAVTVDDFLREVPGITPSIGANVNNGNGGATFVDLRGIGTNRNLTLLNGTRIVPAGLGGVTNIDVIPVALLERVDVLTGGASATYGADAISGVVNFITKDDFEGMDLTALQQITERGDGNVFRADLTLGANFDDGRGNAVLSIGYTNRDAVTQGSRPFGAQNISSTTGRAGGSSTGVPATVFAPGQPFARGVFAIFDTGLGRFRPRDPVADAFNFNPFNVFQLPLEQYRVFGGANYEVSNDIEVFAEALYVQSTSSTIIAPSGSFFTPVAINANNPFLNDATRNQLCAITGTAQDVCDRGGATQFGQTLPDGSENPDFLLLEDLLFGRRFVELGVRRNDYETQLFQIKAGVRADLFANMTFEAFGAYGESENDSRQSGNGTATRLRQSLLAVSPTECLDPSNGCAPINLFGEAGTLDPTGNLRSFLDIGNTSGTETSLAQVQAFVGGDFGFAFPTAVTPISVVLGGEYRKYEAGTFSDLLTQTPGEVLGNGAASPDSFGTYDVKEAFGELAIPLLEDSFIPEVTLLLGGRVSDYSTTGTEYTYKVGGTATLLPGLQFRGNYQKVTRAPNIGELFSPQVTGLGNFDTDPCAGDAPVNNANLRAVCLAQGAPASSIGSIAVDPAAQVNLTTGGNPNLAAEEADTYTIGAIFQPDFVPGLAITVDYYNIDLKDAITSPTTDSIFAACFGNDFRGNVQVTPGSASDPACTGIRRNPGSGTLFGSVATTPGIPLVLTNQGRIQTDGIDLVINYQRDFGFANATFNFAGNWTNSNTFDSDQNDPDNIAFECAGFFGSNCGSIIPEFSFVQRTTLGFGGADLSLLWRFVDEVNLEESANQPLAPPVMGVCPRGNLFSDGTCRTFQEDFTVLPSEHYFDLTARFDVLDNFQLIVAALNITDNQPKVVGSSIGTTAFNSGNIFPSTYDPLGRRYSVTAKITF